MYGKKCIPPKQYKEKYRLVQQYVPEQYVPVLQVVFSELMSLSVSVSELSKRNSNLVLSWL